MNVCRYSVRFDKDRLPSLVREKEHYRVDRRCSYSSADRIWGLSREIGMDTMTEEYAYAVCMDAKMRVIGIFELSHGTIDRAMVSSREVYQKALLIGAVYIALVHNHPSGDPTPSEEDIAITSRLKDAGELIGIPLIDHVIVGDNVYTSVMCEA